MCFYILSGEALQKKVTAVLSLSLCRNYLKRWRVFIWNRKLYHLILSECALLHFGSVFFGPRNQFPPQLFNFYCRQKKNSTLRRVALFRHRGWKSWSIMKRRRSKLNSKRKCKLLGLDGWRQSLSSLFVAGFIQVFLPCQQENSRQEI